MAKSDKKKAAEDRLEALQVNLVDAQIWAQTAGKRICIVFEGRDTAGKDGAIKRITEHLSVRQTNVIALPKPSDREKTQWWFQRYIAHLPATGEWTIFNRSWYNRAGVEKVMGFSTPEEQARFIADVPHFESMLIQNDIILIKLWLDISRDEQKKRLEARRGDPLKRLKVSPLDAVAQAKWDDYSAARDDMLTASHSKMSPWTCIKTDDKTLARENIIIHILSMIDGKHYSHPVPTPDKNVVFSYSAVLSGKRQLNP